MAFEIMAFLTVKQIRIPLKICKFTNKQGFGNFCGTLIFLGIFFLGDICPHL